MSDIKNQQVSKTASRRCRQNKNYKEDSDSDGKNVDESTDNNYKKKKNNNNRKNTNSVKKILPIQNKMAKNGMSTNEEVEVYSDNDKNCTIKSNSYNQKGENNRKSQGRKRIRRVLSESNDNIDQEADVIMKKKTKFNKGDEDIKLAIASFDRNWIAAGNKLRTMYPTGKPNLPVKNLEENSIYIRFTIILEQLLSNTNNDKITKTLILDISSELSKVKDLGAIECISVDELEKLVKTIQPAIKNAIKLFVDKKLNLTNLEDVLISIMSAVDASLIYMHVMTIPNISIKIYEEEFKMIIKFVTNQLKMSVFPHCNLLSIDKKDYKKNHNDNMLFFIGIHTLYKKILKIIRLLSEFYCMHVFTNTCNKDLLLMAIGCLSIRNMKELHLNSLNLVATLFKRFKEDEVTLLQEIFSFVAALHKAKTDLNTFSLNADENIHILTAFILQLIQHMVVLPEESSMEKNRQNQNINCDDFISNKLNRALQIASNFLTVFRKKCEEQHRENNEYEILFKQFLHNLLLTLNKPQWPASDLLLTILGKLLMHKFMDTTANKSVRQMSINYIGTIMCKLYTYNANLSCHITDIDQYVNNSENSSSANENDKFRCLQEILLKYLASKSSNDAQYFYLIYWYKLLLEEKKNIIADINNNQVKVEQMEKSFETLQNMKIYLLEKLNECQQSLKDNNALSAVNGGSTGEISYFDIEQITSYITLRKYSYQKLSEYLNVTLLALNNTLAPIRCAALRSLFLSIEADPAILETPNIRNAIKVSIMDESPSVREVVVDRLGKVLLENEHFLNKYYEIISSSDLDVTAKIKIKVMNIFNEICSQYPEFEKISEIKYKMLKAIVDDDDSVKHVAIDIFTKMWFTPNLNDAKILQIIDSLSQSNENGLHCFSRLISDLYKSSNDSSGLKTIQLNACRKMVKYLLKNIQSLNQRDLAVILGIIKSFATFEIEIIIGHISELQCYLDVNTSDSELDTKIVCSVMEIFELLIPTMADDSIEFFVELENVIMKLALKKYDNQIIKSCLSLLQTLISNKTHNYQIIRNCLTKIFLFLDNCKTKWNDLNGQKRALIYRSIFMVSYILRYFDFNDLTILDDLPTNIVDNVYEMLMYFLLQYTDDINLQLNILRALGIISLGNCELMLKPALKQFYQTQLENSDAPEQLTIDILINFENFIIAETNKMIYGESTWQTNGKNEDLKEMDDIAGGVASTIIQQYYPQLLQCYLNKNLQIRQHVQQLLKSIHNQALIQPNYIYVLIAMCTDNYTPIAENAKKMLKNLHAKFIIPHITRGLEESYELQKIIRLNDDEIVRGFIVADENKTFPTAQNQFLYQLFGNEKVQRKQLVNAILKRFDGDNNLNLSYLLYLADNVAYFTYQEQEEILNIILQLELKLSVIAEIVLDSFSEHLQLTKPATKNKLNEYNQIFALISNIKNLNSIKMDVLSAQICRLLAYLKDYLKNIYNIQDKAIALFKETNKAQKKLLSRNAKELFNPESVLKTLEGNNRCLDEKEHLVRQYLEFKQFMRNSNLEDDDDESD